MPKTLPTKVDLDFEPTFLNPTPATDAFWKRVAMEKMLEMAPAVMKVTAQKR